ERSVMPEIGRPPVLRGCQHLLDVPLDGGQVEALKLRGVVEFRAHGVGHGRVLGEDLQVEPVGPPAAVAAALGRVGGAAVGDRAATSPVSVGVIDDRLFVRRHGFLSLATPEMLRTRRSLACSLESVKNLGASWGITVGLWTNHRWSRAPQ